VNTLIEDKMPNIVKKIVIIQSVGFFLFRKVKKIFINIKILTKVFNTV